MTWRRCRDDFGLTQATVSDDATWKLWSVPNCDLVMSGEGRHRGLDGGVDFHPAVGSEHITTRRRSGDRTVKIWDFAGAACAHTFSDHTQAVWDCAFHHTGDFLASCAMDHTTRLWDLSSLRCRQTLRGHVDSVNACAWQPFSNNICTASGDKTVSIWDARSALCVQTFYGHTNACNGVACNARGDVVASCDADGVVKLWDVRTVTEIGTIHVSTHPVNKVCFDRSGTRIVCAGDDGLVHGYSTDDFELRFMVGEGHEARAGRVLRPRRHATGVDVDGLHVPHLVVGWGPKCGVLLLSCTGVRWARAPPFC